MKILKGLLLLTTALLALLVFLFFVRPSADSLGLPFAAPATGSSSDVQVTWLGVSTLLIDDGTTQLLVDGFFTRPALMDMVRGVPISPDTEVIKETLETWNIDRLAAVMTVHSHYDHAMDVGVISQLTDADVLGPVSTANVARGADVAEDNIVVIDVETPYDYGNFSVTFFESKHAPLVDGGPPMPGDIETPLAVPAPIDAWKEGGSFSLYIQHPSVSFIVQGSAGFIPGQLDHLDVDAVFLGAGGLDQLGTDYARKYVDATVLGTKAETVYLVHYEDLSQPLGTIKLLPYGLGMDSGFAFELSQFILPAQTYLLRFGEAISLVPAR